MSLLDDFRQEMSQTVGIEPVSTHGLYGLAFGALVTYACHSKLQVKNIKDKDGNDAVSSCQIYLDGHPAVEYDSRITYAGETPPIKLILRQWDENGAAYGTIIYT